MKMSINNPTGLRPDFLAAALRLHHPPTLIVPIGAQQVRWSEFVAEVVPPLCALARRFGPCPTPGTDAWLALALDDPRRRIGLGYAALAHVTTVDARQAAAADASRSVSAAGNWSAARLDRAAAIRGGSYIERVSA